MTPEELRVLEIGFMLDEAFRQDASIRAMNRAYRRFRTGDPETDRAIRDHIGMLYMLERAKPTLLEAVQRRGAHEALGEMTLDGDRRRLESVELEAVLS